jgi:hypothetical protein
MAGSFGIVNTSKKLERRHECGIEQAKQRVHAANVSELVRIRDVLAVARYQEVASITASSVAIGGIPRASARRLPTATKTRV